MQSDKNKEEYVCEICGFIDSYSCAENWHLPFKQCSENCFNVLASKVISENQLYELTHTAQMTTIRYNITVDELISCFRYAGLLKNIGYSPKNILKIEYIKRRMNKCTSK